MIVTVVVPYFSVSYDRTRTFQQMLFILAGSVTGVGSLVFKRRIGPIFVGVFVAIYFILVSSVALTPTGSPEVLANFKNYGDEYNLYYVHTSDIMASSWLTKEIGNINPDVYISGDDYAKLKVNLVGTQALTDQMSSTLIPATISKKSYVFLDYANTSNQVAFNPYRGLTLTYAYPTNFLSMNKNLVYASQKDKIYR